MMILKIFVGVDDGDGDCGGDNDDANGGLACVGLGAGLVCKMHSTLRDELNPWIAYDDNLAEMVLVAETIQRCPH